MMATNTTVTAHLLIRLTSRENYLNPPYQTDMPLNTTRKVQERKEAVLKMLSEGCKTTGQIVKALGLTHSEAYYVLEMLRNWGIIVKGVFGKTAVWCLNNEQFKSMLDELLREIQRIIESHKLKYVYPMRLYKLIVKDNKAFALVSRFVPLGGGVAVTLAFLNALLEMLYGPPYFVGEKTVYLTTLTKLDTKDSNPHDLTHTDFLKTKTRILSNSSLLHS
jgi:hypothetical protein